MNSPVENHVPPRTRAITDKLAGLLSSMDEEAGSLPGFRILCRQLACSASTLKKALAILQSEGRLNVVARKGIFRQGCATTGEARSYWRLIYEMLLDDINKGEFAPGAIMPSRKLLAQRYHTSYRTIRKALDECAAAARIHPYKGGYRVYVARAPRASNTVLVIAPSREGVAQCMMSHRMMLLWRAFEYHCRTSGISYRVHSDNIIFRPRPRLESACLGALIMSTGFGPERISELIHLLRGWNLPVAIINECFGEEKLPLMGAAAPVLWLQIGLTETPGRIMGQYLLHRGHRQVAYFDPYCMNEPSHLARYAGMCRVFRKAGFTGRVVRFVPEQGADVVLYKMYGGDETVIPASIGSINATMFEALRASGMERYVHVFDALRKEVTHSDCIHRLMAPVFSRAVQDKSLSAWVGHSDRVALAAMDFLAKHGNTSGNVIRELCGFDNSIESVGANLTSYDFNLHGVARTALDHLISPMRTRLKCPFVEIPGVVLSRQ